MWNSLNRRSGKISYIQAATAGFYFTHATESILLRSRMPGSFNLKTADIKDYAVRNINDAVDVNLRLPIMDTTFLVWKDLHLLSGGPHNVSVVTPEGEYLAFVPTTNNDYVTPNGSEMLGMTYLFKIPQKGGRTLDCDWKGTILVSQEEWIYSNLGVAPAGGSGGVALGLTAFTDGPSQFVPSNFAYALYDGTDVGILSDKVSLEIQSTSGDFLDNIERPYSTFCTVKAMIPCAETTGAQLLSGAQNGILNKTLTLQTRFNETLFFNNGVLRPNRELSFTDKAGARIMMLTFEGEVPYSQIVIDASTKSAGFTLL